MRELINYIRGDLHLQLAVKVLELIFARILRATHAY
jgi:hypothetical protein